MAKNQYKTRAKSEIADKIVSTTKYGTLMEVILKDNCYIPKNSHCSISCAIPQPSAVQRLLGGYEGFGTLTDEIFIKVRGIGERERIVINETHIQSITVYKGTEYNL